MKFSFSILLIVFMLSISNLSAQNPDGFDELMTTLKDKSSTLIIYTVQVGAFRVPNNPKKGHYDGIQNLFSNKYDDKFNRFFSGLFNSIDEAVQYRNQLRGRGYTDAFLLGLDGGFDRILIELD